MQAPHAAGATIVKDGIANPQKSGRKWRTRHSDFKAENLLKWDADRKEELSVPLLYASGHNSEWWDPPNVH